MRLSDPIAFAPEFPGEDSPAAREASGAAALGSLMNEAAFCALYRDTAPGLRGYLRRACGNATLADDLLQETFYRFLRAKLPRGERPQLKAYLYRIAASVLADHGRRIQRERRWGLDFFATRSGTRAEPRTEPKQETDAIRLFRRLKLQDQTLLWLAYVEEFEHGEIAAALNVREKSVRVLLYRARRRLEKALRLAGSDAMDGVRP